MKLLTATAAIALSAAIAGYWQEAIVLTLPVIYAGAKLYMNYKESQKGEYNERRNNTDLDRRNIPDIFGNVAMGGYPSN